MIIRSNPEELAQPPGYTQLVEVGPGRLIFVSGQVALDRSGDVVGKGDFDTQADQVFRNIIAAVTSRGGGPDTVVKLTMFITDMADLPRLRIARDRHFPPGATAPASTLVQVAALFRPEFLIEVEATAWIAS